MHVALISTQLQSMQLLPQQGHSFVLSHVGDTVGFQLLIKMKKVNVSIRDLGLNNIYSGKVHDIHKCYAKIIGSGLFRSSPRHVINSAFYMMVFDEFKHTSIIKREREREREREGGERDFCLVFRGKKHSAIE